RPPMTAATTCIPTTPATGRWPTPSTWRCCCPRAARRAPHQRSASPRGAPIVAWASAVHLERRDQLRELLGRRRERLCAGRDLLGGRRGLLRGRRDLLRRGRRFLGHRGRLGDGVLHRGGVGGDLLGGGGDLLDARRDVVHRGSDA